MNTREKIVSKLPEGEAVVVIGTFDPLLPVHVERLNSLRVPGKNLHVLVADLEKPLLSMQARLELVAALKPVDFVAVYLLPDGRGLLYDDRDLHAGWSADFQDLVRRRNQHV